MSDTSYTNFELLIDVLTNTATTLLCSFLVFEIFLNIFLVFEILVDISSR